MKTHEALIIAIRSGTGWRWNNCSLSGQYREVIVLRAIETFSLRDIAIEMHLTREYLED